MILISGFSGNDQRSWLILHIYLSLVCFVFVFFSLSLSTSLGLICCWAYLILRMVGLHMTNVGDVAFCLVCQYDETITTRNKILTCIPCSSSICVNYSCFRWCVLTLLALASVQILCFSPVHHQPLAAANHHQVSHRRLEANSLDLLNAVQDHQKRQ